MVAGKKKLNFASKSSKGRQKLALTGSQFLVLPAGVAVYAGGTGLSEFRLKC